VAIPLGRGVGAERRQMLGMIGIVGHRRWT
jgi:hypothetical protein